MAEKIVLRNTQSPGDLIVLTAAIRDISKAYPGKFDFSIDTSAPMVFQNNPYLRYFPKGGNRSIKAGYPLIHKSNQQRLHFVWGFLEDLNRQLGVKAPLTDLKPDLHLSDPEKLNIPPFPRPYWIVVSGGKMDFTAKWWHPKSWQKVVDKLSKHRTVLQVGSAGHVHPRLNNVIDLVGKTSLRDLIKLIYHAEGVICIVTCLAHIAAAFNRPCISIAGGREPWWWEAYTNETRLINMRHSNPLWVPPDDGYVSQKYLHTMDQLSCCKGKGCWKSHIGKGRHSLCTNQVEVDGVTQPRCMQLITPDMVFGAVEEYWSGKGATAPSPIVEAKKKEITFVRALGFEDIKKTVEESKADWMCYNASDLLPGELEAVKENLQWSDAVGFLYKVDKAPILDRVPWGVGSPAYKAGHGLFVVEMESVRKAIEGVVGFTEEEFRILIATYLRAKGATWKNLHPSLLKAAP